MRPMEWLTLGVMLALLALLTQGCSTPMSRCLSALSNGDKFTMFENGTRFECERTRHEKARVDDDTLTTPDGMRYKSSIGQSFELPGGWR